MLYVLKTSWPLLLGMLLLLLGNGLQGTLLGIRGAIEGYDAATMSLVMSAYYVGFLLGSRRATPMIARVGHVRVFAALGSMISAAFILYAAAPDVWVWVALRFVVGFCFAGVYVVAESWLNDAATNETRGQALSLYMIVQMVGIISAQFILNLADPAGYTLFVVMSVLVSISLHADPARRRHRARLPDHQADDAGAALPHLAARLRRHLPARRGLRRHLRHGLGLRHREGADASPQISAFVAAIYLGGLVFQFPIGWISDRMDRRRADHGADRGAARSSRSSAASSPTHYAVVLVLGFVIGGVANPLYSLIIAYTNDFLTAVGHGGGLRRAAVHQRPRGDDRAAADRRG